MPDCDYCGASFDGEQAELKHLEAEHLNELGPIDRRRVGVDGADGGFPVGPVALGGVIVAAAAVVVYVIFLAGGGGAAPSGPTNIGSVHYHGTINVTVDGQQLDFGRSKYQHPRSEPAFHFEGGDGSQWHVHAQQVTLQYAMGTLGINVTEDTVTYNGTTYRDSDPGTEVVVQVNGQSVDPSEYVLKRDDHIRIVARQS
jgi:sulfur carrier protein ThiS